MCQGSFHARNGQRRSSKMPPSNQNSQAEVQRPAVPKSDSRWSRTPPSGRHARAQAYKARKNTPHPLRQVQTHTYDNVTNTAKPVTPSKPPLKPGQISLKEYTERNRKRKLEQASTAPSKKPNNTEFAATTLDNFTPPSSQDLLEQTRRQVERDNAAQVSTSLRHL